MKKEVPFFRTAYNYDTDAVSRETSLHCQDESLAVQSERDECDINTIVFRFGLTGTMPQGVRAPMYGDFTGVRDYREALEAISAADEAFYSLPADVRSRFANNPALFVDFCSDPANLDEMRKLGLAVAQPVPASQQPSLGAGSEPAHAEPKPGA